MDQEWQRRSGFVQVYSDDAQHTLCFNNLLTVIERNAAARGGGSLA
jgi:hypothetical protein